MSLDPSRPLKVVLLTDVFPPEGGGSGWSTYYLGKALQDRGHEVLVIRPVFEGAGGRPRCRAIEYGSVRVEEVAIPHLPDRVGVSAGRALRESAARRALSRRALAYVREGRAQVLHGGHSTSGPAAADAVLRARAAGLGAVSVVTIRDYWPLCPVSTRLFTTPAGRVFECTECHRLVPFLRCSLRSRAGRGSALPLAITRWLFARARARSLARCDAVIAVSHYVKGELARSGRVPRGRLHTIPNLVDLQSVQRAESSVWPLHDISPVEPYVLFAGKLDTNKGPQLLPGVLSRSGVRMPVVMAGSGPLREDVAREADRLGLDFRWYDWLDNDAVVLLMSRARALLFPSAWQEPLSRVVLEGLAAGACIVALTTGGTPDAIVHKESGWLARDLVDMAEGITQVTGNADLNDRLRQGAKRRAAECFSAPVVSAQVEALYRRLLTEREGAAR